MERTQITLTRPSNISVAPWYHRLACQTSAVLACPERLAGFERHRASCMLC